MVLNMAVPENRQKRSFPGGSRGIRSVGSSPFGDPSVAAKLQTESSILSNKILLRADTLIAGSCIL